MKPSLKQFVIFEDASLLEAMQQIDSNTKGFVIVIDTCERALGVLTDGDIRRALITGKLIQSKAIEVCVKSFKYVLETSDMSEVIDMFKCAGIKFIPILDEEGRLYNVITKGQMHTFLLYDMHMDLSFDFCQLDESMVDYEVFRKPWGFYKTVVLNDYFQVKIISIKPGQALSLQSHKCREEHWIIAHGTGVVQISGSTILVSCGSSLFIPKETKHRLTNTDEKESLIIAEIQIGDYFGEDDIIRYEDAYGRVNDNFKSASVQV